MLSVRATTSRHKKLRSENINVRSTASTHENNFTVKLVVCPLPALVYTAAYNLAILSRNKTSCCLAGNVEVLKAEIASIQQEAAEVETEGMFHLIPRDDALPQTKLQDALYSKTGGF